jgi:hypothetical protein
MKTTVRYKTGIAVAASDKSLKIGGIPYHPIVAVGDKNATFGMDVT